MSSFVRLPDGTVWPHPYDPDEVEWQLRYGDPARVRHTAAAYIEAYRQLVWHSNARRSEVLREMKRLVRAAGPQGQEKTP